MTQWLDADLLAYKNIPPTPHRVTAILMWLVRDRFTRVESMRSERIKQYVWDKDATKSKILIEYSPLLDFKSVQQRPAVTVVRKSWKTQPSALSIGNRLHSSVEEQYALLISGTHVINVISQNPVEVEDMATEIFYYVTDFTQPIRNEFNLTKFSLDEMGEPVKMEESKEHWIIPLSVSSTIQLDWKVKPIGPLLKTISLNTAAG